MCLEGIKIYCSTRKLLLFLLLLLRAPYSVGSLFFMLFIFIFIQSESMPPFRLPPDRPSSFWCTVWLKLSANRQPTVHRVWSKMKIYRTIRRMQFFVCVNNFNFIYSFKFIIIKIYILIYGVLCALHSRASRRDIYPHTHTHIHTAN